MQKKFGYSILFYKFSKLFRLLGGGDFSQYRGGGFFPPIVIIKCYMCHLCHYYIFSAICATFATCATALKMGKVDMGPSGTSGTYSAKDIIVAQVADIALKI